MTTDKVLEMRGISRKEIIKYFSTISEQASGNGHFCGLNWEVKVGKENLTRLGAIKIPSTKVIFRGEAEIIEDLIAAFRLKFLSAGG